MNGTQRQLEYVPENRTDFIFTVIGEEFGLIGSLMTMGLYLSVIGLCLWLSYQCKHVFSRLLILGITTTFILYIFINLAMVMGLVPVVGVPLPLISYGGTVVLTVMLGFGLVLSAHLHPIICSGGAFCNSAVILAILDNAWDDEVPLSPWAIFLSLLRLSLDM